MKKRATALLTLSILASLAVPSYAAEPANTDEAVRTPDVVVTATRTEEEVKAVPNTVEVITQEDIQKLGATDVYSALRLANNVDVTSAGMAGHNVRIRGMSTNHTLILIDGKRFAGEDTGETQNVYALDRVSLSNIERIEIVRGSASAQYGSDALGGVINIITKAPSDKQSVTVGVSTGTESVNNYYHFNFGKQGNFSSSLDARFTKNRKMADDGGNTNYYGPVQDFSFNSKYDLGNNKNLTLDLGYYNEHTKANYEDASIPNFSSVGTLMGNKLYNVVKDKVEWYDYKRYDVSLGYNGKTDRGDYMLRTYFSKLDKDNRQYNNRPDLPTTLNSKADAIKTFTTLYIMTGSSPAEAVKKAQEKVNSMPLIDLPSDVVAPKYDWDTMSYKLWGIEGKNTQMVNDKHLLTYGGEYRRSNVEGTRMGEGGDNVHDVTQNGVTKAYSEKDLNTYAAYVQDEWMPNEKWLIIPSVRYDHDSNFGSKTTPKLGATYFINDNNRIKANWGKGFKAPTISELYMNMHRAMGSMIVNVYGNPDLKPEESTYWDLSYEAEFGKDNNTWSKLTYFNNDVKNLIEAETIANLPGTYGVTGRYVNVDKAQINGVEFELGHKLNDLWTVKATSNWLDAKDGNTDERLANRAKNMTTLQLAYDDHDPYGYSAILWNQWVSNYRYKESVGSGTDTVARDVNYNLLNFTVNKKFGEGNRIYAGLDNITDKKISDIGLDGRIWRVGAEWTF